MSRSPEGLPRLVPALRLRLWGLAAANVLLVGYLFAFSLFQSEASFLAEMQQFPAGAAPLLLAGIGLTGIIFTGGIDLSIGSIVVMCGTVFGILFEENLPPLVCFAGCCVTAVILSGFNGWLARVLNLPAIIVTLGMLKFYRGFAVLLARWHDPSFSGQFTIPRDALESYRQPGLEWAGVILLVAVLVALIWELHGKQPRLWLAVGNSAEACRLQGLSVPWIQWSAFLVSGVFLGLAALIQVTKGLTIEPVRMVNHFELKVIGAVVLGGTNIFGGEGSYLGTLLGGCLLYFLEKAILYAGISADWQTAVLGMVILSVISLDCVLHRQQKRMEELR